MGKIFEILKQAEGGGGKPTDPAPHPRPYAPQPAVPAREAEEILEEETEEEEEEEVPYIEVGGPRKAIDASPSVLAATVSRLKKIELPPVNGPTEKKIEAPPSPAKEEPPAPVREKPPQMVMAPAPPAEPALVAVAFRPLHVPPPPLPPARDRFAPELVAFHQSQHPVSQQYRVLLGSLLTAPSPDRAEALLFTGAAPGAGTTTTVLNLAITAAREGKKRVVVVDAGIRRPAVALKLGLPAVPGLQDVLAGAVSLKRALQETGQTSLHALTAGTVSEGGCRLVGEAMVAVLRHLRSRFDLIVIDALPWDGRPDVVSLGALCDTVYLVVRNDDHAKPHVAELLQVIPQQGSRLRGCILTYR